MFIYYQNTYHYCIVAAILKYPFVPAHVPVPGCGRGSVGLLYVALLQLESKYCREKWCCIKKPITGTNHVRLFGPVRSQKYTQSVIRRVQQSSLSQNVRWDKPRASVCPLLLPQCVLPEANFRDSTNWRVDPWNGLWLELLCAAVSSGSSFDRCHLGFLMDYLQTGRCCLI